MAQAGEQAVGIDFGTSTSLLAVGSGVGPVDIAPLGRTTRSFPSIAGYQQGNLLVGEAAENLPIAQVIRSVKRAITDCSETMEISDEHGTRRVDVDEVIVALLAEIGTRAKAAGRPLDTREQVRLGCPAMWDGAQRQRLLDHAQNAGLPVAHSTLIDEPIAAGVAWVRHRYLQYGEQVEGRLLVFDMGGGTLDIAVLDVVGGPHPEISVLSALGVQLAGDRLDTAIAGEITEELAGQGIRLDGLPEAKTVEALVLREARTAKIQLTTQARHRIVFRGLARTQLPILTYTREQLEECFRPQMDQAIGLVWAALRAAKLTELGGHAPDKLRGMNGDRLAADIDYVLLAGGMSRVPYVERRIGELFPNAMIYDAAGVAADELIVAGLADPVGYDRLNLHRPGFDFVLEYTESGRKITEKIYPAYTPFYSPEEAWTNSYLGFERRGDDFPGPKRGEGVLRVRSTSGDYLALRYDGETKHGLRLQLGWNMLFKIYCDGQILITDGARQTRKLRVHQWPVVRGNGHAELVLQRVDDAPPVPSTAWYLEKEYAPPGL
ncbi:Hsp70 family protein [Actinomadura formosensis]|uniref:Hsp70 family protein n=1 Tax=Actinomadura formosensis TaxID=60706 RepID=UPI0008343D7D|nr:Hsp70 family protein [Actinomadura formosensis]